MKQKCFTNPLAGGVGMFRKGIQAMLLFVALFGFFSAGAQTAKFPFPNNYEYPHGIVPRSFDNDQVKLLYENWVADYYEEGTLNGKDVARIKFVNGDPADPDGDATVSEGIAYGLLITVYMAGYDGGTDEYDMFKRLWNYYKENSNENNIMNWKVDAFTGNVWENDELNANGATDAELDAAQALLMAYKQWGDEEFLTDAQNLISMIWSFEVDYAYHLKPGDMFNNYKNPCYLTTNAMQLFEEVDFTNSWEWELVIQNSYDLIQQVQDPTTGLIPDWVNNDAAFSLIDGVISNKFESYYLYDAIRTQWRMAQAYSWYGHAQAKEICELVTDWSVSKSNGDPESMKDGYKLDGSLAYLDYTGSGDGVLDQKGKWSNPCFTGGFSCGGMVDEKFRPFMEKGYTQTIYGTDNTYFVETTQLLYALFMGGNMPNFFDMLPEFKMAETDATGGSITVSFSKEIDQSTVAGSLAGWTIKSDFGNVTNAIKSITALDDTSALIVLTDTIQDEYQIITYDGTKGLQSVEGSDLAQFSTDMNVYDNTLLSNYQFIVDNRSNKRPVIVSAGSSSDGSKIFLLFDQEIDDRSVSASISAFTLSCTSGDKTITDAEVDAADAKIVSLVVGDPTDFTSLIQEEDDIFLSYTDGRVFSTNRQLLKNFSDRIIKNNTVVVTCSEIDNGEQTDGTAYGTWEEPWDATEEWGVTLFENPLVDAVNGTPNCIKYIRTVGSDANSAPKFIVADSLNGMMQDGQFVFKFQVYAPNNAVGSTILIHLHDKNDGLDMWQPGHNVTLEYVIPAEAATGWVDVEFDLESKKDFPVELNEFELSVDKGSAGAGQEVYFDKFELCSPMPRTAIQSAIVSYSGDKIIATFGVDMSLPSDASEFKIGYDGLAGVSYKDATDVALDPNDPTKLIITAPTLITMNKLMYLTYEGTSARSLDSRSLIHFTDFEVTNTAGRVVSQGWRDDFNNELDDVTKSLGDESGTFVYVEDESGDGTITVTGSGKIGWGRSLVVAVQDEIWDLSTNQKVTIRAKCDHDVTMRVDLKQYQKDGNGRTTDQLPKQVLTGDGQFHEIVFDATGLWENVYGTDPGVVDNTAISEAQFYIWDTYDDDDPVSLDGTIEFDYIAVGSAVSLSVSTNEINEGETISATCTEDAIVYVVADEPARDIDLMNELVAEGKGITFDISANTETVIPVDQLKADYYLVYAYQPSTGAISIKQGLDIIDVTAPELTVNFPDMTYSYELNTTMGVSSSEGGYIILLPSDTELEGQTTNTLVAASASYREVTGGQLIGYKMDVVSPGLGYILVAVDGSGLISQPSEIFYIVDTKPPGLSQYTATVPYPTDDLEDGWFMEEWGDVWDTITFTATKDCDVYWTKAGVTLDMATLGGGLDAGIVTDPVVVLAGKQGQFETSDLGVAAYETEFADFGEGEYWLVAVDGNGNFSDPYSVYVGDVVLNDVASVEVTPAIATITDATTTKSIILTITGVDDSKPANIATVVWESDNTDAATVTGNDANAVISPVATGDATVTVTVTDANGNVKTATVDVTVNITTTVDPTGVTVTNPSTSTVTITEYETIEVAGTVAPSGADQEIMVASTSPYLSISGTTVTAEHVTAETVATFTVYPKGFEGLAETITVTIQPSLELTVALTPSTAQTIKIGEPLTISATVSNATDKTVTWTSTDTDVATVSGGAISALAEGTTTITATSVEDPTKSKSIVITVEKLIPTDLTVSPETLSFVATETATKTLTPSFGAGETDADKYDLSLTWITSDPSVATVVDGVVTRVASTEASCTITVTSDADASLQVEIPVTIVADVVEVSDITASALTLVEGEAGTLAYTLVPSTTTQTGVSFASSDINVVSIDESTGAYTATGSGSTTITITSTDKPSVSTSVVVSVSAAEISAVTVTSDTEVSLDLTDNKTATVTYSYTPSFVSDDIVISTTSSAISIVGNVITAVSETTGATVTVSSAGNPSASATITVVVTPSKVDVSGVSIDSGVPTTADQSDVINLSGYFAVTPSDATVKTLTYTVSGDATINANGVLTVDADAIGDIIVTVKSADNPLVSEQIVITVNEVSVVTDVTVIADKTETTPGSTVQLTATVVGGNDMGVTWKSSISSITVSSTGLVSIPSTFDPGSTGTTVTFTATSVEDGSYTGAVQVKVISNTLTLESVVISGNNSIEAGKTASYTVVYTPSGYVATNVSWSSTGSISLSSTTAETIIVTGDAAGTASISVTVDGVPSLPKSISVIDNWVPITAINVSSSVPSTISASGVDLTGYVTTEPSTATEELVWSVSSNATIINGVVTPKAGAVGNVVVTASAANVSAEPITLTIETQAVDLVDLLVELDGATLPSPLEIEKGDVVVLDYDASNWSSATDRKTTWLPDEDGAVTVEWDKNTKTVTLTAKTPGFVTITGSADVGSATVSFDVVVPMSTNRLEVYVSKLSDKLEELKDIYAANFNDPVAKKNYVDAKALLNDAKDVLDAAQENDFSATSQADVDSMEDSITLFLASLGTSAAEASADVVVSPVPMENVLTVSGAEVLYVTVTDVNGVVVATSASATVETAALSSGYYIVTVKTVNGTATINVVK